MMAELRRVRPEIGGTAIDVSGVLWVRTRETRWTDRLPREPGYYWTRRLGDVESAAIVRVLDVSTVPSYADVQWSDRPIAPPLEAGQIDDATIGRERLATERAARRDTTIAQEVQRLS